MALYQSTLDGPLASMLYLGHSVRRCETFRQAELSSLVALQPSATFLFDYKTTFFACVNMPHCVSVCPAGLKFLLQHVPTLRNPEDLPQGLFLHLAMQVSSRDCLSIEQQKPVRVFLCQLQTSSLFPKNITAEIFCLFTKHLAFCSIKRVSKQRNSGSSLSRSAFTTRHHCAPAHRSICSTLNYFVGNDVAGDEILF